MREDVKACVDARVTYFGQYFDVPPALSPEVEDFCKKVTELGEKSADAGEFEQQFQASGLMNTFNGLIIRCTPKAYQMTEEDKAYSKQVSKEIFKEDKDRILKEAGQDILETVTMKAESELRSERIRQMSDAGVLDDYTKASNVVEDVGILARWFKKKKK